MDDYSWHSTPQEITGQAEIMAFNALTMHENHNNEALIDQALRRASHKLAVLQSAISVEISKVRGAQ